MIPITSQKFERCPIEGVPHCRRGNVQGAMQWRRGSYEGLPHCGRGIDREMLDCQWNNTAPCGALNALSGGKCWRSTIMPSGQCWGREYGAMYQVNYEVRICRKHSAYIELISRTCNAVWNVMHFKLFSALVSDFQHLQHCGILFGHDPFLVVAPWCVERCYTNVIAALRLRWEVKTFGCGAGKLEGG